jgi:hypothetical protein
MGMLPVPIPVYPSGDEFSPFISPAGKFLPRSHPRWRNPLSEIGSPLPSLVADLRPEPFRFFILDMNLFVFFLQFLYEDVHVYYTEKVQYFINTFDLAQIIFM